MNVTPKLRADVSSSPGPGRGGASSEGGNGGSVPRAYSREQSYNFNGSCCNNTVASNGSGSNGGGRATPTGGAGPQHHQQQKNYHHSYLSREADKKQQDQQQQQQQDDDNATYMSHHTHGSNNSSTGNHSRRFASSPSNSTSLRGGGNGEGHSYSGGSGHHHGGIPPSSTSATSAGSFPRFAASASSTPASRSSPDVTFYDSVKQKGIAKRKRKEYAKDARYVHVRSVVDELNRAMGPEQRRTAIERACVEFNHPHGPRHSAELYLGAANVLCLVLSMSDQEEEIEGICNALEMVYRAEREAVVISYQDVGAALVPLLLRLLGGCEMGRGKVTGSAEATVASVSRVLLHMTRISELRVPLVAHHPGMLAALERVATLPLGTEIRVLRMRLLANLANSEGNKVAIFERASLIEATLKVATLDKADPVREYASAVLMDLSSCPLNQVAMARMDKVLATLVKLAVVEDKVETREYAVSGLQNLAFEKQNRTQLVFYGTGVVIEALKQCIAADVNDKTRRRSAGALTNLACNETAEGMACHPSLLETLARAAVADGNRDVQQRAALALTKLANSITIAMPCWDALLDALVTASRCAVADGTVSAMFRVKARTEKNRSSMAKHPRLLESLALLCLRIADTGDNGRDGDKAAACKDRENAIKAIAHLANEPLNHKLICNKHILAALVHGASQDSDLEMVARDAAILAMERMAMEHSNRAMMARYPGMLIIIAQATEREMDEEMNADPANSATSQPRLAKPLLMSLLVAL